MNFFRDGQEPVHVEGLRAENPAPCVFEHIYFARPDSVIDGRTVYEVRLDLGRRLAEEWRKRNLDVDTVIPIPITAMVLIMVLFQKPKWFKDWVDRIYRH